MRPFAASLPQVLADGETTSLYDLTRLAQEGAAGREYFLTDALGSVRLLVDEAGEIRLASSKYTAVTKNARFCAGHFKVNSSERETN